MAQRSKLIGNNKFGGTDEFHTKYMEYNMKDSKDNKELEEVAATDVTAGQAQKGVFAPQVVQPVRRSRARLVIYAVFKRLFDFILSLLASIILLIPMTIIGLVVVCKDGGSPFYKQKRLGKRKKNSTEYNVINVYKFRSMKQNADNLESMLTPEQLEEYNREYKLKDDPRLIGYKNPGDGENGRCFGAKIRRTSLDELPQILFNICILGNMSLVGPRPILKQELEDNYTEEQQALLLSVKPGLTGYWQAYARNNATYEYGERQQMELYYIAHRSLWLDIKIMFKTVLSAIKREGAE